MIGLVYDVAKDLLYSAIKGKGAYCNGKPIHVAQNCGEFLAVYGKLWLVSPDVVSFPRLCG